MKSIMTATVSTKWGFLVFFAGIIFAVSGDHEIVTYTDYKVYQVLFKEKIAPVPEVKESNETIQLVQALSLQGSEDENLIAASYLVPPHHEGKFLKHLKKFEYLNYTVIIADMKETIQNEHVIPSGRRFYKEPNYVESYHSYCELITYMEHAKDIKHPKTGNPLLDVEIIGKTYEGREMYMVKISSDHKAKKPIVFIEAGMHAREWVAPAAALYIMSQLVENYTAHSDVLEKVDFYIIPVSNPDGYQFSMTKDRMWLKTRSRYNCSFGADGNKNFDLYWGYSGASASPCMINYAGPHAFSEPETRNIRDVGKKYRSRIKLFISLHGYGSFILYPWGYDPNVSVYKLDELEKTAVLATDAIEKFSGTKYTAGRSSKYRIPSSGGSDDYFKGVLGVDLSFTFILSSAGTNGVIVPSSKIVPISSEAFVGIKAMAHYAATYNRKR